ncbi:PGA61 Probable cell wall protein PGA61 [Candida maltosa Xu316]
MHCGMVVQAQNKFCPNDTTGECLCSLSDDDFWSHYAECDCTNPTSLDADTIKSQVCSSLQASSGVADSAAASAPAESAAAESAPVESAPVESAPASAPASAPVESAPVESAPAESAAAAPAYSAVPSGSTSGDNCNMHCKEVDAIAPQLCPDGSLTCLCQLSDSQYWEHVHDCDCINDQNLSIEEIKAQVCNSTTPAVSGAVAGESTAAPSPDAIIAQQSSPVAAYPGSNDTGSMPMVAIQNENMGSKATVASFAALAGLLFSIL